MIFIEVMELPRSLALVMFRHGGKITTCMNGRDEKDDDDVCMYVCMQVSQ